MRIGGKVVLQHFSPLKPVRFEQPLTKKRKKKRLTEFTDRSDPSIYLSESEPGSLGAELNFFVPPQGFIVKREERSLDISSPHFGFA